MAAPGASSRTMRPGPPHVVVLGGPNGAGKSTLAPRLLRDALGVTTFVNADDIARGLSGFAPETVALRARRLMLDRIAELTRERATFALESTRAGLSVRDVRRRRARSLVNFLDAYRPLADTWYLFDGTAPRTGRPIASGVPGPPLQVHDAQRGTSSPSRRTACARENVHDR